MRQRDVFISYKSEEFAEAEWMRRSLEAEGIACWMAPMCITGGSNYAREIPKAIRECSIFVLILSKKAQESIWVPKELDQAINMGKKIMPFVIEEFKLNEEFGFYLSNVQQYYAFRDRQAVFGTLLLEIKKTLYMQTIEPCLEEQKQLSGLKVELSECMEFDRGCVTKQMLAHFTEEKIVQNSPLILITDKSLSNRNEMLPLLGKIKQSGSSLFIIAENFSEEMEMLLFTEKMYGGADVVAVKAPSYGERRKEILKDLAILTGGLFISKEENDSLEKVALQDLGCAEIVEVYGEKTKIAGGMGSEDEITKRIEQIRRGITKTYSTFEKEKMQERIEKLRLGSVRKEEYTQEMQVVTRKYSNGIYVGTIREELPHGKGRMEYETGDIYDGEWSEGSILGKGRFESSDGEVYEGEFRENIFNGNGMKIYQDGSKYEGNWNSGRRHGQGRYEKDGNIYDGTWENDEFLKGKVFVKYSDGAVYEGEWSNNQQNGQGIYYAKNGDIYEGKWENHQFVSGKCVIKYRDGREYSGGFSNGTYNGKGCLKYLDGSSYDGDWVNGIRSGNGRCVWANGTIYDGHWENDIANGYGVRSFGNIKYEGFWKDGKRHGYGTFTYSNGDRHACEWVDGQPWGNGTYTYQDGSVKTGFFKNDQLWSGEGTIKCENGDVYVGQIEHGVYHGNGVLKKTDGTQFAGTFENGVVHGKAIYTDPAGQRFSCKYNHGKQVLFSMKKI